MEFRYIFRIVAILQIILLITPSNGEFLRGNLHNAI